MLFCPLGASLVDPVLQLWLLVVLLVVAAAVARDRVDHGDVLDLGVGGQAEAAVLRLHPRLLHAPAPLGRVLGVDRPRSRVLVE